MNAFSYLDDIFPTGAARTFGEVVSIWVRLENNNMEVIPVIGHKRKAWYANASVNAWHLHRSLCHQFRDVIVPTESLHRKATRSLRALVGYCYEENYRTGRQYFEISFDPVTTDWSISTTDTP